MMWLILQKDATRIKPEVNWILVCLQKRIAIRDENGIL